MPARFLYMLYTLAHFHFMLALVLVAWGGSVRVGSQIRTITAPPVRPVAGKPPAPGSDCILASENKVLDSDTPHVFLGTRTWRT